MQMRSVTVCVSAVLSLNLMVALFCLQQLVQGSEVRVKGSEIAFQNTFTSC